jgi:hypothetical protein
LSSAIVDGEILVDRHWDSLSSLSVFDGRHIRRGFSVGDESVTNARQRPMAYLIM